MIRRPEEANLNDRDYKFGEDTLHGPGMVALSAGRLLYAKSVRHHSRHMETGTLVVQ